MRAAGAAGRRVECVLGVQRGTQRDREREYVSNVCGAAQRIITTETQNEHLGKSVFVQVTSVACAHTEGHISMATQHVNSAQREGTSAQNPQGTFTLHPQPHTHTTLL